MTATRQHGDILILGHSLEAALTAVLLARRGASVVWAGAPRSATEKLGAVLVPRAPSLVASTRLQPALGRALDEAGLLGELEKLQSPVTLQVLSETARATAPACPEPEALDDEQPPAFKPFALGGWLKRRQQLLASRPEPTGEAGRLVDLLASVIGDRDQAQRVAASPTWLPGGDGALTHLLWKRFAALGGRAVAQGLDSELTACRLGWSEVQVTLGTGEQLGARVLVFGADDEDFQRLTPARRLQKKVTAAAAVPLWRLSWAVKARGLPIALGPAALVAGDPTLLVERHPAADGLEALSVFWRQASPPDAAVVQAIQARLLSLLPFFDRHIVATGEPTRVRFADALDTERSPRPGRRVLLARTPALTLSGADGGALLSEGLSRLAVRLAPRKDARP